MCQCVKAREGGEGPYLSCMDSCTRSRLWRVGVCSRWCGCDGFQWGNTCEKWVGNRGPGEAGVGRGGAWIAVTGVKLLRRPLAEAPSEEEGVSSLRTSSRRIISATTTCASSRTAAPRSSR